MLSIQLLGSPNISDDGTTISVPRRKSRALLYYLAAHSAPVTRERVLALLWPDHERAAAQQILRTSLHGLRKALGAALLVSDDALSLARDVAVDARIFEASLAAPAPDADALAAALALYRGDFLAGFGATDSEEFEQWVDAERERLRQLALRGLATLAQRYEARRDYPAALAALGRALAIEPMQEEIQRAAMRLHYLSGDRAGAIRRYEQLRRLLDDELGVPPMEETRALYDAIIKDEVGRMKDEAAEPAIQIQPVHPSSFVLHPSALPFTGRAAELAKLREIVGARKLALIEGEPGIGKTRLAEVFLQDFDGLVLIGAGRELEHSLPYQPIIEALRGLLAHAGWASPLAALNLPPIWLAEAARLLPELNESAAGRGEVAAPLPASMRPLDESRLWEGIHQLLLALARRQPIALLLDDLHWADASTLALLGYLARQAGPGRAAGAAPIAYLATVRPVQPRTPLSALVQTLTREDRIGRLPLARLSPEEMTALARRLSPDYAYPLSDWLARNSSGNPYFLAELVRYAREQALLRSDGVLNLTALSDSPVLPGAIYSLIESRLARLSQVARRVLDVAVAVGHEFDMDVVARAAGLADAEALDALDELRAAGLVTPLGAEGGPGDGLHCMFDHTLTMEVAYREVGEPRHRLIHRQVAEAIESLHEDDLDSVAGLLASHFAEGNAPERAAHYAFRAGERASALAAWAEAIAFYEQALLGAEHERRVQIYMALGNAYFQSGAPGPAADAYRAALELAEARDDDEQVTRARLTLGQALVGQARYAEAIAIAQQVLAAGRPQDVLGAQVLWGSALSVEGVDLAGAAEHLRMAAALGAAEAHPAVLAQAKFELGSVAAQQGQLREAIAFYREALEVAETHPDAAVYRILAHNNLAYHLMLLGDSQARQHAELGLAAARESGVLGFQPFLLSTLGEIELSSGDLDAAERCFAEGFELAEQLPVPERVAGLTANLGLVALGRGQAALAIHRFSTALARADALGTRHLAAQIRIWLAPLLPPAEARATLAEARALAESGGRALLLEAIDRLEEELRVRG